MGFEAWRPRDGAQRSWLPITDRAYYDVVVAPLVSVPTDPNGTILGGRNRWLPVIRRGVTHPDLGSPTATAIRLSVDIALPVAKRLPSHPERPLPIDRDLLMKVRPGLLSDAFDRAPPRC